MPTPQLPPSTYHPAQPSPINRAIDALININNTVNPFSPAPYKKLWNWATTETPGFSEAAQVPQSANPQRMTDINLPSPESDPNNQAHAVNSLGLPYKEGMGPSPIPDHAPVKFSMHLTSPEEHTALATRRGMFNVDSALEGLRANQLAAEQDTRGTKSGLFPETGTEELYRQSFGDPNSMAPGAPQLAQQQLHNRLGDEDFNDTMMREQYKAIMNAIASGHSAIQGLAEAGARRQAMPAMITGQARLQGEREKIASQERLKNIDADIAASGGIDRLEVSIHAELGQIARSFQFAQSPEGKARIAALTQKLDDLDYLRSGVK